MAVSRWVPAPALALGISLFAKRSRADSKAIFPKPSGSNCHGKYWKVKNSGELSQMLLLFQRESSYSPQS